MRPSNRTLALAFALLAVGAFIGGGAFTSVTAERTASINVAGDASAFLAITPHSSANSQDVFLENGQLRIEVSPGSTTTYTQLLNITNQGTQSIAVWVTDHDHTGSDNSGALNGDVIGDLDDNNTASVTFFNPTYGGNDSCENGVASIEGIGNAVEVVPGGTLEVDLRANTSDVSGEEADLLDEISVHGDATVSGVSSELNTPC